MTMVSRDPFADALPLRQAMDRLFEQSLPRPGSHWLAIDVYETTDELVIKAMLPGIKPEDVDIAIDGDTLTITGEFKADAEGPDREYHRRELHVGTLERAVRLPERFETEKADAVFEHGLLTLTIPKVKQAQVKHIKVQPRLSETVKGAITR
ncbi:MAG: Hsp20/alpha crystallin family protein [Candidatus Limnocylindrales bacterium]